MDERIASSVLYMLHEVGMTADSNTEQHHNGRYPVTSLYFDSPFLSDYQDKAGGFINRKKIRVRIYTPVLTNTTPEIWLEKKEKYDMRVSKKRVRLTHEDYKALIDESYAHLLRRSESTRYGTEILHTIIRQQMRPRAIVRYDRTPLVSKSFSDLRITIDSRIEACLAEDMWYTPSMIFVTPHTTVMEVKFSRIIPPWFRQIRDHHNLVRTAFSKYANSLEAMHRYYPIPR